MKRTKPLICIIGESGTGKTTLANDSGLTQVVSYTDRAMREDEINGVDYHFRTTHELQRMEREGNFSTMWHIVFGSIKACSDYELLMKDLIVVTWQGVQTLKDAGYNVYVVECAGEPFVSRDGRDFDETIPDGFADFKIDCRLAREEKADILKAIFETL